MAPKRRAPSPYLPPPPPLQQSSSGEESGSDTEEEEAAERSPRAAAAAIRPRSSQLHPSPAAGDDAGEESDSDSDQDADAQASKMHRPGSKPADAPPQLESDDGEEEDGGSQPEPKKAAPANMSKTAAPNKKRPAPEAGRSGKVKKAKEGGKEVPKATPIGKGKKANVEKEKGTAGPPASGKSKKSGKQESLLAIAAAASEKDSSVTRSKKSQANKSNVNGNSKWGTVEDLIIQNIDTEKGSNKVDAVEVVADRNVKSKLVKEGTGTATQNGNALLNDNGGRMDRDAPSGNENSGTDTEEENHECDAERGHRSFDEMRNLYPQLAGFAERFKPRHMSEETLKMAFGLISDEKAKALEYDMEQQGRREAETHSNLLAAQKELLHAVLPLVDGI